NDKLKKSNLVDQCRFEYNSFCIVRSDSSLQNFDQITQAAAAGRMQFVFGDPLSASSAILPMHVLHSQGVDFRQHMEYTFGQSESVHRLCAEPWLISGNERLERVAFVFDLALSNSQEKPPAIDKSNFRPIKINLSESDRKFGATMTDILLPMEVWVARKGFDEA